MAQKNDKNATAEPAAKPGVVCEIPIRYRDLDTMGHVNNALYLTYFEQARIDYLHGLARDLGLEVGSPGTSPEGVPFGPLEGAEFVIAEANVRYRAAAKLGDRLRCVTRIPKVTRKTFVFEYELRSGDDLAQSILIAEGSTVQVFFDPATGRSRGRPEWFAPAVATLEEKPEAAMKEV